jgi:hypothetical protein
MTDVFSTMLGLEIMNERKFTDRSAPTVSVGYWGLSGSPVSGRAPA